MKRTRVVTIALLLVAAAGCPLTLSDFTVESLDGGPVDATTGADASADGKAPGPDGATMMDAGGPDTACSSLCVPAVPLGWTFVSYDQASRPSCAPSYGTPTDVQEGVSAPPATCGCTCDTAQPACTSLVVTAGKNGTCDNQSTQTEASDGGCDLLSSSVFTNNVKMSAAATPLDGGCTPDASVVTTAVTFGSQGRVCELTPAPGGGCGGGACVPDPTPFVPCVSQPADAGVVACPAGYPVRHIVGTMTDDTRGCTPCSCGYDAGSCGGSVTLSNNGSCGNTLQTIAADRTCHAVSNHLWQSFTYTAAPSGAGCTPSAVTATGDAGFADPMTVCCTK